MSVMIGAFIFGIGMQLGGGCASGTLYTVGGGSARMLVTLLFFCIGSVIATSHLDWWFALPHLEPISLVESLGVIPGLLLSFIILPLLLQQQFISKRNVTVVSKLSPVVNTKAGRFIRIHGL